MTEEGYNKYFKHIKSSIVFFKLNAFFFDLRQRLVLFRYSMIQFIKVDLKLRLVIFKWFILPKLKTIFQKSNPLNVFKVNRIRRELLAIPISKRQEVAEIYYERFPECFK